MKLNLLKTSLILAVAFGAALHSSNAQIITNGSFETPDVPTFVTIAAGQTNIAPWVVNSGTVDVVDASFGVSPSPAFQGQQYLDLDGISPGRVTQSFATTIGLSYTINFAYANNYINQPSASATVRLFDVGGNRLLQTITHSTSVPGNLNWTIFGDQFTAVQSTTSLEFSSLSSGPLPESGGGIFLDAVQIQVVPEPASAVLLLLGVTCCLSRRALRTNDRKAGEIAA